MTPRHHLIACPPDYLTDHQYCASSSESRTAAGTATSDLEMDEVSMDEDKVEDRMEEDNVEDLARSSSPPSSTAPLCLLPPLPPPSPSTRTVPPPSTLAKLSKPPLLTTDQYLDMEIAKLVSSGRFNDCEVECHDGNLRVPRAILALAIPDLYHVLRSREEQVMITLVDHLHSKAEVAKVVEELLTRGLGEHHVWRLQDVAEEEEDDDDDEGGGDEEDHGEGGGLEEEDEDRNDEDYLDGDESGEDGTTDTSIEGEDEQMQLELATLALPDLATCSCCKSCLRKRRMAERKPKAEVPYSVSSDRSKRRKKAARVKGVEGVEEAQDIVDRLYRDFPDLQAKYSSRTTNLRLMTLIRDLRLSYNQVGFIFP